VLIQCDASQLEWRVCLELCQDETGIQEILDKADVHSLNEKAFQLPSRLIAKIYLFRTIFNHGKGYAFTMDPDFMHVSTSVKYWDDVGQKFYSKYAGLEKLYQKNMALVAAGKPLEGPLGRFWPLEMERGWNGELKIPETKVVNYPTQGTGADVMTIARISFWNRLKKLHQPQVHLVRLVSSVHDSIVVDAPTHLLQCITDLFHQVFDDLQLNIKKLFKYDWRVPLACEVKYGVNMKDMQKCLRTDL
jgi:DNA polymerase I-like protein with 3'-5' exonuclease and polymerase domains